MVCNIRTTIPVCFSVPAWAYFVLLKRGHDLCRQPPEALLLATWSLHSLYVGMKSAKRSYKKWFAASLFKSLKCFWMKSGLLALEWYDQHVWLSVSTKLMSRNMFLQVVREVEMYGTTASCCDKPPPSSRTCLQPNVPAWAWFLLLKLGHNLGSQPPEALLLATWSLQLMVPSVGTSHVSSSGLKQCRVQSWKHRHPHFKCFPMCSQEKCSVLLHLLMYVHHICSNWKRMPYNQEAKFINDWYNDAHSFWMSWKSIGVTFFQVSVSVSQAKLIKFHYLLIISICCSCQI